MKKRMKLCFDHFLKAIFHHLSNTPEETYKKIYDKGSKQRDHSLIIFQLDICFWQEKSRSIGSMTARSSDHIIESEI